MVGSPPCHATTTSGARLGLDQLADVPLVDVVGHAEPAVRIQHLLGQEEAVSAIQVADCTGRLGHQVEGERRVRDRQDGTADFGFDTHRMQDATFRDWLAGSPGPIDDPPAGTVSRPIHSQPRRRPST